MSEGKLTSYEMIDQINLSLKSAKTALFSSSKVILERTELEKMLKQLEASMPDDLKKARDLLEQEANILAASRTQAEKILQEANSTAQATVEDANAKAQASIKEAQDAAAEAKKSLETAKQQADETVHMANEQAKNIVAAAQNQANGIVADSRNQANLIVNNANAQAARLVDENEITARAEAAAQELRENTQRECADFTMQTHATLNQLLEMADVGLSQRLDDLRRLRQEITANS